MDEFVWAPWTMGPWVVVVIVVVVVIAIAGKKEGREVPLAMRPAIPQAQAQGAKEATRPMQPSLPMRRDVYGVPQRNAYGGA